MVLSIVYVTGIIFLSSSLMHGAEQKMAAAYWPPYHTETVYTLDYIAAWQLMALQQSYNATPFYKHTRHWNVVCDKQKKLSTKNQTNNYGQNILPWASGSSNDYSEKNKRQQFSLSAPVPLTILAFMKEINNTKPPSKGS